MSEQTILNPKQIEFTLPSGKKVVIRECTGLDEYAASRKFIGKTEDEKQFLNWEIIAQCIISLDNSNKKLSGFEELLKLSTKDLNALLIAYNNLNTPTAEEIKEITDFFVSISKK